MSIRIRKVDNDFGVWNGYTCEFVNPEFLGIEEDEIKEYLKGNPYPEEDIYKEEAMIQDIINSTGSYIIPCKRRKTAEFISDMINDLM